MSLTLAQIIRLLTVSKPKRQKAKNYDKEMQSYNLRKQYKAELSQNILMWKSSFTAMLNRNSRNSVYYSDLIEHFKLTEHEIRMASDFFNEKKQSLEWLFNTLNEDDQYAICLLAYRLSPPIYSVWLSQFEDISSTIK